MRLSSSTSDKLAKDIISRAARKIRKGDPKPQETPLPEEIEPEEIERTFVQEETIWAEHPCRVCGEPIERVTLRGIPPATHRGRCRMRWIVFLAWRSRRDNPTTPSLDEQFRVYCQERAGGIRVPLTEEHRRRISESAKRAWIKRRKSRP